MRLIRLLNDALGITSIVVPPDLVENRQHRHLRPISSATAGTRGRTSSKTDDPRIRQFVKGIPDGPVPFHYPARDYRADLLGER